METNSTESDSEATRAPIGRADAVELIPSSQARRVDTKEIHVRVSIPNYQYLDQIAIRYGMRSLSEAVNFLIESHRQCSATPTLGHALSHAKQEQAR